MVFSSLVFVCGFLPLTVGLYYVVPVQFRNLGLVVASFVFYSWGDPLDAVIIAFLILANYSFGLAVDRAVAMRRLAICLAVSANLCVLIAFKYAEFIVGNVNYLLGALGAKLLPPVPSYLPLGISFITFHIISYLVDVYRRTMPAQRSIVNFALYIGNFPQLIAGPIIRYHEIAGQIESRKVTLEDVDAGIARFTVGLGKKLLVANPIGAISDTVFALPTSSYPPSFAWIALVCYTLQIYFDFSGYTDMAIGFGRMFGFRFPENFNYPYVTRSMQDFWRRWHMSLSRWFRDYLYIPLGGSRDGDWTTTRNLWTVFLLVGAWHGASWNFIVWGAWHGLFLSLERLRPLQRLLAASPAIFAHAYAMGVVMIGWVFFRSQSLSYAVEFIGRLCGLGPTPQVDVKLRSLISLPMTALVVAAAAFSLPLWPAIRQRTGLLLNDTALSLSRTAAVVAVLILAYASMTIEEIPPFIYFRF